MKLTLVIMMLFAFLGNAYSMATDPIKGKGKDKKERVENTSDDISLSKNFHSIKKWKVTIEYINGTSISEIVEVKETTKYTSMEMAFKEAEKYTKNKRKVTSYSVSPMSNNSFVLLAGGR